MFLSPKSLTALKSVLFSLLLTSGLALQSTHGLASEELGVENKPIRISNIKDHQKSDVSREQFLRDAIAMEENLFSWRNGSYIPCDEDNIHRVMENINASLGEESFVRSVMEDYEQNEKDLHNIYEFPYLEF